MGITSIILFVFLLGMIFLAVGIIRRQKIIIWLGSAALLLAIVLGLMVWNALSDM